MHVPFHEWLQLRCTGAGFTGPAALATALSAAGFQVDRRTVWRWATGKRTPAQAAWPALATVLEVPLDQLALRVVGVTPMGGEE